MCAQIGCAGCADNDPPSVYQSPSPKLKRFRLLEWEKIPYDGNLPRTKNLTTVPEARAYAGELAKRTLPEPSEDPWNGDQDGYIWTQILSAELVPLRTDLVSHSFALAYALGTELFNVPVQDLYGCTSLIIFFSGRRYGCPISGKNPRLPLTPLSLRPIFKPRSLTDWALEMAILSFRASLSISTPNLLGPIIQLPSSEHLVIDTARNPVSLGSRIRSLSSLNRSKQSSEAP